MSQKINVSNVLKHPVSMFYTKKGWDKLKYTALNFPDY